MFGDDIRCFVCFFNGLEIFRESGLCQNGRVGWIPRNCNVMVLAVVIANAYLAGRMDTPEL